MKQFASVVSVPRFLRGLHLPTLPTWELLAAYAGHTVTNLYNTGGVRSRNSRAAPNVETTRTCVQFPWLQKSLLIFQGRVSIWRKEEKACKPSLAVASWELAKLPLGSGGKVLPSAAVTSASTSWQAASHVWICAHQLLRPPALPFLRIPVKRHPCRAFCDNCCWSSCTPLHTLPTEIEQEKHFQVLSVF